jgi:hypothetical protein
VTRWSIGPAEWQRAPSGGAVRTAAFRARRARPLYVPAPRSGTTRLGAGRSRHPRADAPIVRRAKPQSPVENNFQLSRWWTVRRWDTSHNTWNAHPSLPPPSVARDERCQRRACAQELSGGRKRSRRIVTQANGIEGFRVGLSPSSLNE